LYAVTKFSRYFGRSLDRLGLEDVRAFQVQLVSSGLSWPALNQTVCALRFFFGITLGGVVTLSFSGWKGQRLVDIQATQAAIFHASKASSRW